MNCCGCGRERRRSFFCRQNSRTTSTASTATGNPAWLRSRMRKMQKQARNNKKTVRMIAVKDSPARVPPSFSKGRVALDPQSGQGGVELSLAKQYPRPQGLVEFGKQLLAVTVFLLLAEDAHA